MSKLLNWLLCRLLGHNYPSLLFDNFSLCYCTRCGKEVADRTWDDILPVPDDHDWHDDLFED